MSESETGKKNAEVPKVAEELRKELLEKIEVLNLENDPNKMEFLKNECKSMLSEIQQKRKKLKGLKDEIDSW